MMNSSKHTVSFVNCVVQPRVFGEEIGSTTFNSSRQNRKKNIIIKGFENRERNGPTDQCAYVEEK